MIFECTGIRNGECAMVKKVKSKKNAGKTGLNSIVVIEPNRQMQNLLRAMLSNFGHRSVRIFDETDSAVTSMLSDPPCMVLLDWDSGPYSGRKFLKLIRHEKMFPLCLVPIVVLFAHARQKAVESAMRLGAQSVLVKPISPAILMDHIKWVVSDERELKLVGERYVVAGVEEKLDKEIEKQQQLSAAREYQAEQLKAMDTIQSDVDRILTSTF